jgi:Arc/MetJ-type ribon-helix-helix transcriptional regulator
MKTTLIIDDSVLARLKEEAVKRGRTISELVESALRLFLERKKEKGQRLQPLPRFDGERCLVDVADRDALYRAMEGK